MPLPSTSQKRQVPTLFLKDNESALLKQDEYSKKKEKRIGLD